MSLALLRLAPRRLAVSRVAPLRSALLRSISTGLSEPCLPGLDALLQDADLLLVGHGDPSRTWFAGRIGVLAEACNQPTRLSHNVHSASVLKVTLQSRVMPAVIRSGRPAMNRRRHGRLALPVVALAAVLMTGSAVAQEKTSQMIGQGGVVCNVWTALRENKLNLAASGARSGFSGSCPALAMPAVPNSIR
jgi:hypothetical protein